MNRATCWCLTLAACLMASSVTAQIPDPLVWMGACAVIPWLVFLARIRGADAVDIAPVGVSHERVTY